MGGMETEFMKNWEKAFDTWKEGYVLKVKTMKLYRELGTAILYERALQEFGLTRQDVSHMLLGKLIGPMHNYRGNETIMVCGREGGSRLQNWCVKSRLARPQKGDKCIDCDHPLIPKVVPISPSRLLGYYAEHFVGIETNDGRYFWLDKPVALPTKNTCEYESPTTK